MREASYYTKITEDRINSIRSSTLGNIVNSIDKASNDGKFYAHINMTGCYDDIEYYKELLTSLGFILTIEATGNDLYMKISWYP